MTENLSNKELETLKKLVTLKQNLDSAVSSHVQRIKLGANPFPEPDSVDPDINKEIINRMKIMIERQELSLYSFLDNIEHTLNNNKFKEALILSYYCYNVMKDIDPAERMKQTQDILKLFEECLEENE